jgi:hypothetical protein
VVEAVSAYKRTCRYCGRELRGEWWVLAWGAKEHHACDHCDHLLRAEGEMWLQREVEPRRARAIRGAY